MEGTRSQKIEAESIDFDELGETLISRLQKYYLDVNPDANEEIFWMEIPDRINSDPQITGNYFCNHFFAKLEAGEDLNMANVSMMTSCAYLFDAERAKGAGDMDKAWKFMAEARYWNGVMIGADKYNNAFSIAEFTIKETNAKSGAEARAKKYLPLKHEAYRLIEACRPNNSAWKSVSHARTVIKKKLFEFAKLNKYPELSDQQFVRTFATWVRQMPNSQNFFESSKKVNDLE
ncbi:hypothetical protein H8K52_18210 [Undibacterium seohonense]|uniref:Uncharacterized protein n=1 Tax=Undibacterium seohonense TaxID=1344950 RepID=A0ABR6X932_9BURK|nr:hypothetical protein [Undibacterium seohonense]MBC3809277.1 hypothetical protein [Undibacterium seohonense]